MTKKEILTKQKKMRTVNNPTKVSIIVPVYNTEKYISQCLESILAQSYRDIEALCIDGGSTDSSVKITEEYAFKDSRIRVEKRQFDSAGAARNLGIEMANGKYCVFVDSDDYIEPDMIEKLLQKAEKSNADIVCFPCKRYNSYIDQPQSGDFCLNRGLVSKFKTFSHRNIPERLFQIGNAYPFSRLYRVDFLRSTNIRFQEFSYFDDIYFSCVSMEQAEIIAAVTEPLYIHRMRPFSRSAFRWQHAEKLMLALVSVWEKLIRDELADPLRESFCDFALGILINLLRSTAQVEPRYLILDALCIERFDFLRNYIEHSDGIRPPYQEHAETLRGALQQRREQLEEKEYAFKSVASSVNECTVPKVSVIMPVY